MAASVYISAQTLGLPLWVRALPRPRQSAAQLLCAVGGARGEQSARLVERTKYTLPHFQQCALDVLRAFQRVGEGNLKAVVEKYGGQNFQHVGKITAPASLIAS